MKRFLLFAGDCYYPLGGWRDYIGCHDTAGDAIEWIARGNFHEWWQIVDSKTMEVVQAHPCKMAQSSKSTATKTIASSH